MTGGATPASAGSATDVGVGYGTLLGLFSVCIEKVGDQYSAKLHSSCIAGVDSPTTAYIAAFGKEVISYYIYVAPTRPSMM